MASTRMNADKSIRDCRARGKPGEHCSRGALLGSGGRRRLNRREARENAAHAAAALLSRMMTTFLYLLAGRCVCVRLARAKNTEFLRSTAWTRRMGVAAASCRHDRINFAFHNILRRGLQLQTPLDTACLIGGGEHLRLEPCRRLVDAYCTVKLHLYALTLE
jgi:hypothetical protein